MENNNLPCIKQNGSNLYPTELNNPSEYISRSDRYFKELESGIYELIELSNVPDIVKIKGAKMYHSRYFVKLNARTFKPRQLLGILRGIIEHSNYEMVKNKMSGI